jgi:hypothetical protein
MTFYLPVYFTFRLFASGNQFCVQISVDDETSNFFLSPAKTNEAFVLTMISLNYEIRI